MAEQIKVTDENKKTIIAFVTGLLIGGLLVYIFANPAERAAVNDAAPADNDTEEVSTIGDEDIEEETEDRTETTTSSTAPVTPEASNSSNVSGDVEVDDQAAGNRVALADVEYPAAAGWIGIRDYENGRLTGLLGVARWNEAEGLMPTSVELVRATEAGKTYAVVFYSDNGDKKFNLATDVQISDSIETFVAR